MLYALHFAFYALQSVFLATHSSNFLVLICRRCRWTSVSVRSWLRLCRTRCSALLCSMSTTLCYTMCFPLSLTLSPSLTHSCENVSVDLYSIRVISHGIFTHLTMWVHLRFIHNHTQLYPICYSISLSQSTRLLSPIGCLLSPSRHCCNSRDSLNSFWQWNQQLFSFSSLPALSCVFVCVLVLHFSLLLSVVFLSFIAAIIYVITCSHTQREIARKSSCTLNKTCIVNWDSLKLIYYINNYLTL